MVRASTQFPQRALLLGVLWFPATFLALWVCAALGLWSAHHIETTLAVFFVAVFLLVLTLQIKVILRGFASFRSHSATRLPINYLLLAVGVLTAVIAAGLALLLGIIAINN